MPDRGHRNEFRELRGSHLPPGGRAGSGTHILPFEFAADDTTGPAVTVLHADGTTSPAPYLHVRDGRIDEVTSDV